MAKALTGRKLSEDHKKNISEANKGKVFSEDHKKHLADASARRGNPAPNKGFKKVFYIKYKDGIFTAKELSELLNVSERTVLRYLKESKLINNFNLTIEDVRYEKLSME